MVSVKNWKLNLPVNPKGGFTGICWTVSDLVGFEYKPYYDPQDNGDLVMIAPAESEAKTSSNTEYVRCELREMINGKEAAWMLTDKPATMVIRTRIDSVAKDKDGSGARMVIAQIHGKNEELIRLYYEPDTQTVNYHCDISGTDHKEHVFTLWDAFKRKPEVRIGDTIEVTISATKTKLDVTLVDFAGSVYKSSIPIDKKWLKDKFYFKAGVYLGTNKKKGGTGQGGVTISKLDITH
jgi:hypothetical protein